MSSDSTSLSEYLIKLATTPQLQQDQKKAFETNDLYNFLVNQGLSSGGDGDARPLADAQNNETATNVLRLRLIEQTGFRLLGDSNSVVNQIVGSVDLRTETGKFKNYSNPDEPDVKLILLDDDTGEPLSSSAATISGTLGEAG